MPAIATITGGEMRDVDRIMIDEYGIDLVRMMENAGRALAHVAISRFAPSSAVVLAGPGGNGGGGLVAARHLTNRGVSATVVLARPDLTEVARKQLQILRHMGVPITAEPRAAGLVIDALIGYGLHGDPRGRTAELIDWANTQPAPVLALDNPSGLDPTHGLPQERCVSATATLSLALPKAGLLRATEVGELYLADIGIPPAVYSRFGINATGLFDRAEIIGVATTRYPDPHLYQPHSVVHSLRR